MYQQKNSSDSVSIPCDYVRALLELAANQGCDPDWLMRQLDISPQDLDQSLYFSVKKYAQLYRLIVEAIQNEFFGMFTGGRVKPGSLRMLCTLLVECGDLREVINLAGDFQEVCSGMHARCVLAQEDGIAQVRIRPVSDVSDCDFEKMVDRAGATTIYTQLAMCHRFCCWLIGREIELDSLYLSFPSNTDIAPLVDIDFDEMKFDQAFNGVSFSADYLSCPVVQSRMVLEEFLRVAPYHLLTDDASHSSLRSKVRIVLSQEGGFATSADEVASRLHMSSTTLRRRLQAEHTSYQKIKDECRKAAALYYLRYPGLGNGVIAERLGFDESAAFFRAFKKWTGVTPGEYREATQVQIQN